VIGETIIILVLLLVIIGLVYQFMFDIFLVTLIGIIVFYVIFLVIEIILWRKRNKTNVETKEEVKTVESPKEELKVEEKPVIQEDPDINRLKDFIKKNLDQGFKENIVRVALEKQGWAKDKVNIAFQELNK
jgi:flagellar biosynthesis/type III secretory pathway M-ring protein FliF/YscJ